MASEMRRIAAALVATRTETFESRYGEDESRERASRALAGIQPRVVRIDPTWIPAARPPRLELRFSPGTRAHRFLRLSSIVLTLLIVLSAWLIAAGEETPLRFLVPLFTVLAMLGFPFAALGVGSQREAEEARAVKAIRRALVDEEQT